VTFGDQTGNETEVIVSWNKDRSLIEEGETAYLIALSKSEIAEFGYPTIHI
jgi:hypothetical protein